MPSAPLRHFSNVPGGCWFTMLITATSTTAGRIFPLRILRTTRGSVRSCVVTLSVLVQYLLFLSVLAHLDRFRLCIFSVPFLLFVPSPREMLVFS